MFENNVKHVDCGVYFNQLLITEAKRHIPLIIITVIVRGYIINDE